MWINSYVNLDLINRVGSYFIKQKETGIGHLFAWQFDRDIRIYLYGCYPHKHHTHTHTRTHSFSRPYTRSTFKYIIMTIFVSCAYPHEQNKLTNMCAMCLRYQTDRIDGNVRQQTRLFHPCRIQTCFEPSSLNDARSSFSHWCVRVCMYCMRYTERHSDERIKNVSEFGRVLFARTH